MGASHLSRIVGLDTEEVHVVVPAYCEADVIAETVDALLRRFRHVVVVDDGSPDATAERACEAGAVVLRHAFNLGQGAALQTGITYALERGARYVATFDADGQHSVADLEAMLVVLAAGRLDVTLGSRFLGEAVGLPRMRSIVLKAAVLFTRATSGLRLTDAHNGLRVMTAEAARKLTITQNRMAHASELINQIARLRLKYEEVPVTVRYTEYSLTKGQKLGGSAGILVDLLVGWLSR
jgi:glycosyltransferase involved in cell wall biosynthesis